MDTFVHQRPCNWQ